MNIRLLAPGFGRLRALGGGRTDTAAAADQGQNQSTQANQNPLRTRGAGRQTAAGSAGFPAITTAAGGPVRAANPGPAHRIRLVPHLEASRSLRFDPASRDLQENGDGVKLGRFNDRRNPDNASQVARTGGGGGTLDMSEIAFRSKVVSRGHAELWVEDNGQVRFPPAINSHITNLLSVFPARYLLLFWNVLEPHPAQSSERLVKTLPNQGR